MTNDIHARLGRDEFVGAKFGDFLASRPLAQGGLATLYLARRASLRSFVQPIALHVFHPQLVRDARVLAAINEEGRVASYLEHPGIGRVFDFGEANGTFYVAAEYVFGETLATVLRELRQARGDARFSPQLVAYVFIQVCEALHSAHMTADAYGVSLHVVHGALSPSRLHVGYDRLVHVLDFGMAKLLDRVPVARAHSLNARLPYLAPEQVRDEEVDLRADVWSLGVMLREVLSGQRVFGGKSATEIIHGVLSGALPAWPDHVPRALREIADRAVQRDPRARYPNAQSMSADLRAFSAEEVRSSELRLASWMRTFFALCMLEKQAMLRETFRGTRLELSRQTAADELQGSESPTIATFISEGPDTRQEDPVGSEDQSEPTAVRSHIRLASFPKQAAADDDSRLASLPPAPRPLPPTSAAPASEHAHGHPPARAPRKYELAIALGALLLGIALALIRSPEGIRFLRTLVQSQLDQDRGSP